MTCPTDALTLADGCPAVEAQLALRALQQSGRPLFQSHRVVHTICLTFDNGPEPGVTDFVLDSLALRDVRAAFFVVGSKLEDGESLRCARRAAQEGHRVGNHTYHHREPLGLLGPDASRAEIARTQALLDGFVTERLFRPVGGVGLEGTLGDQLLSPAARDLLIAEGFTVVLWNVVPRDWEQPHAWVDIALDRCRRLEHAVVVLHDLPGDAMTQLPSFLERAIDEGARFSSDFPLSCVVLDRGVPRGGLDAYVREAP